MAEGAAVDCFLSWVAFVTGSCLEGGHCMERQFNERITWLVKRWQYVCLVIMLRSWAEEGFLQYIFFRTRHAFQRFSYAVPFLEHCTVHLLWSIPRINLMRQNGHLQNVVESKLKTTGHTSITTPPSSCLPSKSTGNTNTTKYILTPVQPVFRLPTAPNVASALQLSKGLLEARWLIPWLILQRE